MIGPGKYDDICTEIRERTESTLCCLIIGGGNKGDGMSLQLVNDPSLILPTVMALRAVADQLENDLKEQIGAAN
jgi:hypothetical protein